jgi:hypothetical protein
LAEAVNISHSLDLLQELSAHSRADEPAALAEVADAITLLDAARRRLVDNADRLSDLACGK